jgi:hypothetical protein
MLGTPLERHATIPLKVEKIVLTDRTPTRTLDWKTTVQPGAPAIKNL